MNTNYQRKFRTQSHPSIQPVQTTRRVQQTYQPVVYQQVQPVYQPIQQSKTAQPSRHRRKERRKRRSLLSTVLMIIGTLTLFVLLMRYAIVPLLVLLPQWLGGAA